MKLQELTETILEEIRESLSCVNEEEIQALLARILEAGSIYVDGKGRSGLMAAGFAMRLGQLGRRAFVPSGVTTPPIGKGDLLVICSGSGETEDLVVHAKTASRAGASIVLLTTNPHSSAGSLADQCIVIRARSKYQPDSKTIQPMGSTFEQGLQILFDALIIDLMERTEETNETMMARHNNLE